MTSGCAASSASVTAAPISSARASALMARSSATWLMSISTGGATMPRRMLTTRSVPPPSSWLPGWSARASSTSSSVRGRRSSNCGSASIRRARPASRAGLARAPLLDRREHAVGRHRQIVEAHAGRIGDGVGQRRQERRERALARLLGAERPVRIVALDDADLDRRRILDGRHAVVEHVGGEQQALVVGGLLAHGLAHAHPHRALHLAFDGEPVERLAAVVRDPHLVDGDHAGLLVDASPRPPAPSSCSPWCRRSPRRDISCRRAIPGWSNSCRSP